MKVNIVSPGTGADTELIDLATGQRITDLLSISAVTWKVAAGGLASAEMEISIIGLDADVEPALVGYLTKHPLTGQLAPLHSLRFADGTMVDLTDGVPRLVEPEPDDDLPLGKVGNYSAACTVAGMAVAVVVATVQVLAPVPAVPFWPIALLFVVPALVGALYGRINR